nr:hypothetical protein Iba_chr14dCG18200 [Ipomoea batatas]
MSQTTRQKYSVVKPDVCYCEETVRIYPGRVRFIYILCLYAKDEGSRLKAGLRVFSHIVTAVGVRSCRHLGSLLVVEVRERSGKKREREACG